MDTIEKSEILTQRREGAKENKIRIEPQIDKCILSSLRLSAFA
jgi:hypothetical protein